VPDRYEILFRPEIEEDLRPLGRLHQKRALSAIEDRLAAHPAQYGKPLGGNLAGLRRIRTGDFRIAYQVKGSQVIIWAIMHRNAIYTELVQRFSRRSLAPSGIFSGAAPYDWRWNSPDSVY